MRSWSIEEKAYLKANYTKLKNSEIAEHLGRTIKAIRVKARKLGLRKYDVVENYNDVVNTKQEMETRIKMKNYKVNVEIGDKVKIIASDYDSKKYSNKRKVNGKVVFKNKNYLVVNTGKYKESFLFSDFYTGIAKIIIGG